MLNKKPICKTKTSLSLLPQKYYKASKLPSVDIKCHVLLNRSIHLLVFVCSCVGILVVATATTQGTNRLYKTERRENEIMKTTEESVIHFGSLVLVTGFNSQTEHVQRLINEWNSLDLVRQSMPVNCIE